MIFSVVDLETTGVYNKDRVIEVGIILMDETGAIHSEFETLVNPRCHIGQSDKHGIEARHLVDAPTFDEVGGTILELLHKSDLIVSHNLDFDRRMLSLEYNRLGYDLPLSTPGLCTLQTFQVLAPGCPRDLGNLCAQYEIPLERHHSALSDARAVTELLKRCLGALNLTRKHTVEWKPHALAVTNKRKTRSDVTVDPPKGALLERLVAGLPSHEGDAVLDSYFELLDRVFADSILEDSEQQELFELACSLGMNTEQVNSAHETYVRELLAVAARDRYISELELEHLTAVSGSLGVNIAHNLDQLETLHLYPRDLAGKSICFTGDLKGKLNGRNLNRKALEALAMEHGMEPQKGVTKKLDLLIVKDPHTLSEKAKRAHSYGVPIVAEQVFWNWLGLQTT